MTSTVALRWAYVALLLVVICAPHTYWGLVVAAAGGLVYLLALAVIASIRENRR